MRHSQTMVESSLKDITGGTEGLLMYVFDKIYVQLLRFTDLNVKQTTFVGSG